VNVCGHERASSKLTKNLFSWGWAKLIGCFTAGKGFSSPVPTILSIFAVLTVTSCIYIYNDITDVKGDEIYGVRTMALVLSWKTKVQMLTLFILAIMTLTPFTYARFGFNVVLPIMAVAMGLVVLIYLIPLSEAFERVLFLKTRKIAYVYYILLHIALVVATLNL
jgi:4-hydroxybenzoate polyprenyltransferase